MFSHAFSCWQALRHPADDRRKGRVVTSCAWSCSAPENLVVLAGKRGVPVRQGLGIGFLARDLGGSCLKSVICPAEEERGSAHMSLCCSTPKGFAGI